MHPLTLHPLWPVVVLGTALVLGTTWLTSRHWSRARRAERVEWAMRCALAVLVLLIGLRPTTSNQIDVPVPSTTDLFLVIDRTASMGALDGPGGVSRIEALGHDLAELVTASGGANVTVITFDDDARVAIPSTTDANAITTFLHTMGWRPSTKASGSDISVAADLTGRVLAEARAAHPGRTRYLVYAGDGEQTASADPGSFTPASEGLTNAWVLGYGTAQGGAMPIAPGEKETVEINRREQLSRIDPTALQQIAQEVGGSYLHRPGDGLPTLPEAGHQVESRAGAGTELSWWLALLGAPLLLGLLVITVRGLREAQEELR